MALQRHAIDFLRGLMDFARARMDPPMDFLRNLRGVPRGHGFSQGISWMPHGIPLFCFRLPWVAEEIPWSPKRIESPRWSSRTCDFFGAPRNIREVNVDFSWYLMDALE
eukprot:7606263-Pyramimonas_sp.AAC.1